jgi:uncharacterized protein YbjT (DUF2867 family)
LKGAIFMTNSESILVTGATGTVGRETVEQLVDAGQQVRVLVRDLSKAKFDDAVEVVQGDLSRPETLEAAFAGVKKAFVIANYPNLKELEINAYAAAQRAGVLHVVKLSAQETFQPHMAGTEHARTHIETEQSLRESGLSWTMLRPGFFASNFLFFVNREQSAIFLPTGEGKEGTIHPRDIAAVAVKALTTPGHESKIYELTGPDLLSYPALMEKLSAVTGKQFRHVDVTEDESRNQMLSAGFPPVLVEAIMSHCAGVKTGCMQIAEGVSDVLGRPALSFSDWARENIAAFS